MKTALIVSMVILAAGAATAGELKKATCVNVHESSSGPNVLLTCNPERGAPIPMVISGSVPNDSGVGTMNAMVLAFMQMKALNPEIHRSVKLMIEYSLEKPEWSPEPKFYVQRVSLSNER